MSYADFHVHGSFKAFFTAYDVREKASPWKAIIYRFDKILFRKRDQILSSQACFEQLYAGNLTLAVMPLYSTERAFASSFLLRLVDFFSKNINRRLFREIRTNESTYWQQLDACYRHLLRAKSEEPDGHSIVNFTRSYEDFQQEKMNIVFSLEGAHSFLDNDEDVTTPAGMQMLVNRLMLFKKRYSSDYPRIFIMNLTHLTAAPFSNHAFGMKFINHAEFAPRGRGLSLAGEQLIKAALLQDQEHYPIIIDVKHMSLIARQAYYQIRRESYPHIPVLASHVGCTGISIHDIPKYILEINSPIFNKLHSNLVTYKKPEGIIPGTCFNPWSINLYDEDIAEILSSGGIIGISLDQRILGSGKVVREKMSKAETFKAVIPDRPLLARDPDEPKPKEDPEGHFRHFCNNIFHIVKVAARIKEDNIDPWSQIVIGSDFDGLIDAVDFCSTGAEYQALKEYLLTRLDSLAEEAGIRLPYSVQTISEKILYENADQFLQKYYRKDAF